MSDRTYSVQSGILKEHSDGSAEWIPHGDSRGRVRLKVTRDSAGRRLISQVVIDDDDGVAAGALREIPLGTLEDVLNRPQAVSTHGTVTFRVGVSSRVIHPHDPDHFYAMVAQEYAAAAAMTRHPAAKLAQDRGVSPRTVTRWLTEARKRGLLPTARRSRRER